YGHQSRWWPPAPGRPNCSATQGWTCPCSPYADKWPTSPCPDNTPAPGPGCASATTTSTRSPSPPTVWPPPAPATPRPASPTRPPPLNCPTCSTPHCRPCPAWARPPCPRPEWVFARPPTTATNSWAPSRTHQGSSSPPDWTAKG